MVDARPALELCAASYSAHKLPGTILVFAHGVHPTSGFRTLWAHDVAGRSPATLVLWHLRPTGPVLHVITPFSACTSVQTTEDLRSITVRDATGEREIPVEEAPAALAAHAG
jgi:hypothetical protein